MRLWQEVNQYALHISAKSREDALVSQLKWFPFSKGGDFRKWYGNNDFVVNWKNDGEELLDFRPRAVIRNPQFYFKPGITWTLISSSSTSFRQFSEGFVVGHKGPGIFARVGTKNFLSLLNSKVASQLFEILSPTIGFEIGHVNKIPVPCCADFASAKNIVQLSRTDWDNFETSWDFQTHPLLRTPHPRLGDAFLEWQETAATAFAELKQLEEENNRYWIDAYGLQDELTPEVPDAQITIRRANLARDVKSLISFAVGCMMGRYSLAQPGLQFAGGSFDPSSFSGDFLPDDDGILPITDEAYFEDDIVSRFMAFLSAAFGPEGLQDNLTFVADALARKPSESAVARIRRYFLTEFISDHIQTYKKRPVYWLFTSGKGRAFGALVYLHRYTPDTLAYLRNSYVLPLQSKLGAEIRSTERALSVAGSASAAKTEGKRLAKLREQVAELLAFHDRLLHKADQRVTIDLDDGVAYNYTLFDGLLYTGADLKLADLLKKSQWKRDLLAVSSA